MPFRPGGPGDRSVDRERLLATPVRWPRPELEQAPLTTLPGVGPKLAARAAEAGVHTVGDLLWRVPGEIGEPPGLVTVAELEPNRTALVAVTVQSARSVRTRHRRSLVEARAGDGTGPLRALWFNQPWILRQLQPGSRFLLEGRPGERGFVVAAAAPLGAGERPGPELSARPHWNRSGAGPPSGLEPDGPRTRRPGGGGIGSGRWRRWSFEAARLAVAIGDPVPPALLARHRLPSRPDAFRAVHFPASEEEFRLARRRLAWEELLLYRVRLERHRQAERAGAGPAPALDGPARTSAGWRQRLPFRLTGEQERAIEVLAGELAGEQPMRRLLMGEVGAGKTVVALAAMLRAVESGRQAVLMAPTTVLAEQHADTVDRLLEGTGVRVGLLTGATGKPARQPLLKALAAGRIDLVVGTHALLEPDVTFRELALAVIDEEHRFGVRQREALEGKTPAGRTAHRLHLSATPIPRTLSLTAYGDLDVTTLRRLPTGRRPVRTRLAGERDRARVFAAVRKQLDRGRQAFVVCPLVEATPGSDVRAAVPEAERLAREELHGYRVGLLHGRMGTEQKQRAMAALADGRIQVLVATTVIEVGVDVPNATVMVIESPERFGLSQLHQLRGRVGRGEHAGACFLMFRGGGPAGRRLAELAGTTDGFRLAELDLRLRGEGELLGTRQHGTPRFRVASLPDDADLLEAACEDQAGLQDGPATELLVAAARARFGRSGPGDAETEPG